MRFSYNLIQKYISESLPEPHKLADLLTMHSFEVEGIEKKKNDYIFDIDILPNRAHDAVSHKGIARDAVAILRQGNGGDKFINSRFTLGKYKELKSSKTKIKGLVVDVKTKTLCNRYMAAIVKDVKVAESPKWLKEQLENLGLSSINNVVDAVNYAMLITGQPLHVFDYDKLENGNNKKIIVRKAKNGEIIETLDGENYILDSSMLVIADSKDALAIAGIKGGIKAEVTPNTKTIIIESANFDPISIRRTSKSLGLRTDASWRFEHALPVSIVPDGMHEAISSIKELASGNLQDEVIDIQFKKVSKKIIALRPEYVRKLLGITIGNKEIKTILSSLEFKIINKKDFISVEVPPFRLDVEVEEDLVEEVGRIFGYENIDLSMPTATLYPPNRNLNNYWLRQIKNHLSSVGFNEMYNYSFISERKMDKWNFAKKNVWEVSNPVSEEFKYMRPSLLPLMLKAIKENLKFYEEVKVFEVGDIFKKISKKPKEESRLSILIAAKIESEDYFYMIKGEVEDLFNKIGISDIWFDDVLRSKEEAEVLFLHPFRRAQIKIGDKLIGVMGQIHPRIAHEESFKGGLFIADIDLVSLMEESEKEVVYMPISSYPQTVRDISVILPKKTKANEVVQTINISGGKLLRDVDMFDYYDEVENNKEKSMAFHLIFQSDEKTLKSKEVDELMSKIYYELENVKGWSIK